MVHSENKIKGNTNRDEKIILIDMHWTVSLAAQMYFSHIMHSVLLDFGGLCKDYSELVNGAEYQISLAVTKIFLGHLN